MSVGAFAQIDAKIKTLHKPKNYSAKYDKFKDRTTVLSKAVNVRKEGKYRFVTVAMSLAFQFAGENITDGVDHGYLLFSNISSEWEYIKSRELRLIVDGERVNLGEGDWDGTISSGRLSTSVIERVMFKLDRDLWGKIANAKTIEFQLGTFEAPLDTDEQQIFKDMLFLSEK